jgi:hypothetical protein
MSLIQTHSDPFRRQVSPWEVEILDTGNPEPVRGCTVYKLKLKWLVFQTATRPTRGALAAATSAIDSTALESGAPISVDVK